MSEEKSIEEQIEALNERRAKAREAHENAYKVQHLKDMQALADLEDEHGVDRIIRVGIRGWKAGCGAVTMVVVRKPEKRDSLYKRFTDQLRAAAKNDKLDPGKSERAGDLLAESCIVYPAPPAKGEKSDGAYEATLELVPGLLSNVAGAIVTAAMGKAEEEGKD